MALEQIAIYVVIALVGASGLSIILFGVRSVVYGKIELLKMVFISFPLIVFAVLAFVMPTLAEAGIYTLLVMIALAVGGLLFTSLKGVFR